MAILAFFFLKMRWLWVFFQKQNPLYKSSPPPLSFLSLSKFRHKKYAAGDPLPSVEIAVSFGSLGSRIRKHFVKVSQKQNSEKKPTKQRAAPITQLSASLPLLCTRRRSKPFSFIIALSPPENKFATWICFVILFFLSTWGVRE